MKQAEYFVILPVVNILLALMMVFGSEYMEMYVSMELFTLVYFVIHLLIPVSFIFILKHFRESTSMVNTLIAFIILVCLNKAFFIAMERMEMSYNTPLFGMFRLFSVVFFILDVVFIVLSQQLKSELLKRWFTLYFAVILAVTVFQYIFPYFLSSEQLSDVYSLSGIPSNTILLIFFLKLNSAQTEFPEEEPNSGDDLLKRKDIIE